MKKLRRFEVYIRIRELYIYIIGPEIQNQSKTVQIAQKWRSGIFLLKGCRLLGRPDKGVDPHVADLED